MICSVTLIQYGFALRTQLEAVDDTEEISPWSGDPASNSTANGTIPAMLTEEQASAILANATTEWLSFFLMTVGAYP